MYKIHKLFVYLGNYFIYVCITLHRTVKNLSRENLSMLWKGSLYAQNASESTRMNKRCHQCIPLSQMNALPYPFYFTAMLVVHDQKGMNQ